MRTGLSKTRTYSKRHYVIVMAFAIVLALMVASYFLAPIIKLYLNPETTILASETEIITPVSEFIRSAPARLQIPAINIDTDFVSPLGLSLDQTVSVPDSYTKVGWYSGGSTPGENGPAVILGHVDSKVGPAIFYSLGQLNVNDEIQISRADGTVVVFVVEKLQRYLQSEFPTQAVYGPTASPTLRLVTCSGTFDKEKQRYSHNLVVYAKLR